MGCIGGRMEESPAGFPGSISTFFFFLLDLEDLNFVFKE